jgi:hypothetical protein
LGGGGLVCLLVIAAAVAYGDAGAVVVEVAPVEQQKALQQLPEIAPLGTLGPVQLARERARERTSASARAEK